MPNLTTGTVNGRHLILVIHVMWSPGLANHRVPVMTAHAIGGKLKL
jgi:hypothetical protein